MIDLTLFLIACGAAIFLIKLVCIFFVRPDFGFYLIVLSSISQKPAVSFAVGSRFIQVRPVDILTILLAVALILRIVRGKNRFSIPPGFGLFVAFFVATSISLLWSKESLAGIISYGRRLILFVMAIATYQVVMLAKCLRAGLRLLYGVAFVTVFFTGVQIVANIADGLSFFRPSGYIFYEAVYLALFCVPVILLLIWHPDSGKLLKPLTRLALIILLFIALLLSLSRISWYVFAICLILGFSSASHRSVAFVRRYLPLCGYFVALMIIGIVGRIYYGITDPILERVALLTDLGDIRWTLMRAQIASFLESPVLGVGMGSTHIILVEAVPDWSNVFTKAVGGYNIVTGLLAESGLLGFAMFVAILGQMWHLVCQLKFRGDHEGFLGASTLYLCLLSTVLWSLFQPPVINNPWFWLFVSLTWASISSMSKSPRQVTFSIFNNLKTMPVYSAGRLVKESLKKWP